MKLFIFDLDNTLTKSKEPIDDEMALMIAKLLEMHKMALVSGSTFKQIKIQFLSRIPPNTCLSNLFLIPQSGSTLLAFVNNKWKVLYNKKLAPGDKRLIRKAFGKNSNRLEDKDGEMTFSALGKHAPLIKKKKWDPKDTKRNILVHDLLPKLPGFEVKIGGTTSIDVTKQGINKGYGVRKLLNFLSIPKANAVFFGDALFPGGNDYSVLMAGIKSVKVKNPQDTKREILSIIEANEPKNS